MLAPSLQFLPIIPEDQITQRAVGPRDHFSGVGLQLYNSRSRRSNKDPITDTLSGGGWGRLFKKNRPHLIGRDEGQVGGAFRILVVLLPPRSREKTAGESVGGNGELS
ncbi:hypothetical protein AVEN_201772-1 [Araneus ventricosus]|uniref:Uncharacterized protein n=1 Tax=Araneus ventricosus TaxID=182803 RepID=A0A4Y2KXJ4_ARAVE|nr:hypothetical protein AVEN_201772-1 [Araneus ventricosus]